MILVFVSYCEEIVKYQAVTMDVSIKNNYIKIMNYTKIM
jgi:hypothetical protein